MIIYALATFAALCVVLAALLAWHELAYRRARDLILSLLQPGLGCTGVDFVRRSNGKLGRGTVYVWLDRMEDEGLIESEPESDLSATVQAMARAIEHDHYDPALYGTLRDPPRRRIYRLKAPPC